jgi:hypothetical protein
LDVPTEGKRWVSELERLRKGVFRSSSKDMVAELRRLADIEGLGAARLDISAVPPGLPGARRGHSPALAFVRRHLGIDGHYSFHLPDLGGAHRPLRDADADDDE